MDFFAKYKPKKLKSVIYKLLRRFVTGLVFALLWDRFLNAQKRFLMAEHAFFVLGVVFLALAWVNYLKIDGLKIHYLNENKKKAGRKRPKTGFLIDYAEEEPSPLDSTDSEYDETEETKTSFVANLLAGICFTLPSLFLSVFF
jgi:hypothetical protein